VLLKLRVQAPPLRDRAAPARLPTEATCGRKRGKGEWRIEACCKHLALTQTNFTGALILNFWGLYGGYPSGGDGLSREMYVTAVLCSKVEFFFATQVLKVAFYASIALDNKLNWARLKAFNLNYLVTNHVAASSHQCCRQKVSAFVRLGHSWIGSIKLA